MRIGANEIIEELTAHMRKSGGEPGEWQVGAAAANAKLPIQNSRENPPSLPGLAYREAFTTYAAADAVDYLVSAFGLHPERDLPCEPGNIVFVYRTTENCGFPPSRE
jgi:hypothetical protein